MKKRSKSLLSLILVFALVFTMVVPAAAKTGGEEDQQMLNSAYTPTLGGSITHGDAVKLKQEGAYKYVAIGDSTAAGYSIDDADNGDQGLEPWGNYKGESSVKESYPSKFASKLLDELLKEGIIKSENDFSWSNLGVSSYQMYDYYRVLIDKNHTSVLFNNMLSMFGGNVEETKKANSERADKIKKTAAAIKGNRNLNDDQQKLVSDWWTTWDWNTWSAPQDTVAGYILNYYNTENNGKSALYAAYGIDFNRVNVPWFQNIKKLNPQAEDYSKQLVAELNKYLYKNETDSSEGYTDAYVNYFKNKCFLGASESLIQNAVSGSYQFYELFQKEIPTADLISLNIGANDLLEQFMFDLVRTSAGKNADTMDGMTVTGVTYKEYEDTAAAKAAFKDGKAVYSGGWGGAYTKVTEESQIGNEWWNSYYEAECAVDNVFMFVTWAALFQLMGGQEMSSVVITVVELLDQLLDMRYGGDTKAILEDLQETLEYLDAGTVEEHIMDNGIKAMQYYEMVVNMIKRGGTFPNIVKMNQSGNRPEEDEYGQLYFADKDNQSTNVKFDFNKLSYTLNEKGECVYKYDGHDLNEQNSVNISALNPNAQIMYVGGFNPFGTNEWYDGKYYSTFDTAVYTIEALFKAYKTETLSAGNLTKANLEIVDLLVGLVDKSSVNLTSDTNSQLAKFIKGNLEKTHSVIGDIKDLVSTIQKLFNRGGAASSSKPMVVEKTWTIDDEGDAVKEEEAASQSGEKITTCVSTIDENNNPVSGNQGGTVKLISYKNKNSDQNNNKLKFTVEPNNGYFPYGYVAVVSYKHDGKDKSDSTSLINISANSWAYPPYHDVSERLTDKSVNVPKGAMDISVSVVFKKAKTWDEMVEFASTKEGKKEIYSLIKAQVGSGELSLDSMNGIVDKLVAAVVKEYGAAAFKGKNDTQLMKVVKTDLVIALLLEQVGFSEESALELGMTIGLVLEETSYPLMYTLLGEPGQKACDYENELIKQYAADPELGGPYVSILEMPNENNMNPHPLTANHEYIANQMYDAVINNVNLSVEGEGNVYGPDSKVEGKNSYTVMYNFDANFKVFPAQGYTFKYYIDGKEYVPTTTTVTVPNVKKDTQLKIVFYDKTTEKDLEEGPYVEISSGNISLNVGATKSLSAVTNQQNAKVSWTSSNPKAATVDNNGKVRAIEEGTTYITAIITVKGKAYYDTVKVTITKAGAGPESISLDVSKIELEAGKTAQIKATVLPESANQQLTYSSTNPAVVTVNADGLATAIKPGKAAIIVKDTAGHQVSVSIVVKEAGEVPPVGPVEPVETGKFVDVAKTAYYFDAVEWAAEKNITSGIDATHFGPNIACSRAHMVTFLWRAMGCPEPTTLASQFTDVVKGSYYEKAVAWAVEKGITKGITDTLFGPDLTVLRGQAVTFLARAAGIADDATGYVHSFIDVFAKDYYNNAVAWAASKGITTGITKTEFAPKADCTRAQIVTFLFRFIMGA